MAKKQDNTLLWLGVAAVAGFFIFKKKQAPAVSGVMSDDVDAVYKKIKRGLGKGREKTVNDSLHFGVGNTAYVYASDANKAGLAGRDMIPGHNSTFVHLTDNGIKHMLNYLLRNDGYLMID